VVCMYQLWYIDTITICLYVVCMYQLWYIDIIT